jgi:hypothetical protein
MTEGYTVAEASDPVALTGKVQTLIREGWQPKGTMHRIEGGLFTDDRWVQQMEKEKKEIAPTDAPKV